MRVLKRIHCKLFGHTEPSTHYEMIEMDGVTVTKIHAHYNCKRCNKNLVRPLFHYELEHVIAGRAIYE